VLETQDGGGSGGGGGGGEAAGSRNPFEHNMWAYVRFLVLLLEQDRDEDDGLEQYVRGCFQRGDMQWFPREKAQRL
jgi:hypothetical protein